MYLIMEKYKKILVIFVFIGVIISTQLTTSIVVNTFTEDTTLAENIKLLYVISFFSIVISTFINFIFIKVILSFFKMKKSNLTIFVYVTLVVLLFLLIEPLSLHIVIKTIIKVIIFNIIFQEAKFKNDLFIVSLIIGIVDMLMTLLLTWG